VYRVLETLLLYLDREDKWEQRTAVKGLLGVIKYACGDQTFPLYTSLMRHSSSPGLSVTQRMVIINEAVARVRLWAAGSIRIYK
jgi:hypothetical protein